MDFYRGIISRLTTAFQFMLQRDQPTALRTTRQAIGMAADGTISENPAFPMGAGMAAVTVRAGPIRLSDACGIADDPPPPRWWRGKVAATAFRTDDGRRKWRTDDYRHDTPRLQAGAVCELEFSFRD
jgi:hypothetical protein